MDKYDRADNLTKDIVANLPEDLLYNIAMHFAKNDVVDVTSLATQTPYEITHAAVLNLVWKHFVNK